MAASRAGRNALSVVKLSLAVVVAGLLLAGLMLPEIGGLGIAARNSVQAFDNQTCDVKPVPPPQRSTIFAADGTTPIATFFSQNREVVAANQIPDVMRQALVSIEDKRFYQHHGVDIQGLTRAVIANSRSGTIVQGGSTLTMQYVKLVQEYTATNSADSQAAIAQTTGRKLVDARCALVLEQQLTKDEILARYLNIAYFGASAYGVGTAARVYFGQPVDKLTLPQAALLAGLVQSPTLYDPYQHPKAAKERRDQVLTEMRSLGYVTAAQEANAKATPIHVVPPQPIQQDCANANAAIPNAGFFCDYAKVYLQNIGFDQAKLNVGGYKIITTLDPGLQAAVQSKVFADMPANLHATSVMDVLDTKTGLVRAMAVSKHYGINRNDPTQTSIGLGYQPVAGAGSTYKLFTLIGALQRQIPLDAFKIKTGGTTPYAPKNCSQTQGHTSVANADLYQERPYSLDDATYESVNTFFVALIDQEFNCDLSIPVNVALSLGMNALKKEAPDIISGQKYSFTLGPQATSPLELASAYATVANDGKYCPPTPVAAITGPDGKNVALPEHPCVQKLDPGLAHTVSSVLVKDTTPSFLGTAQREFTNYYGSGGSPVAGKTGTASTSTGTDSGSNSSAWFVGYTPDTTAAVATFNPAATSTALSDVPGFSPDGREVFGAFSAGIWVDALGPILLSRPAWQFPPADPVVVNGRSVPVPSVKGQDVATATATLNAAGFQVQLSDQRTDSPLPPDRVADQSPSDRGIPGQTVILYLSNGKGGGGGTSGGGRRRRGGGGGGGGGVPVFPPPSPGG